MKKISISLCLMLVVLCVHAGPVNPKRAATVASNFWSATCGVKRKPQQLIDRSSEWGYSGIYLFTHPDGGFVLVAADDNAKPILGYSIDGTIDPSNMPVALQSWLGGYQQQLDALASLAEGEKTAYGCDALDWWRLENGIAAKDDAGDTVAPLLTTQWDQQYPYNIHCPSGTVTGCAATAQAQMMNFWHFPAFGSGMHTYMASNYGALSCDFSHTLFQWDSMPAVADMYSSNGEVEAVASLMSAVGVSLEMSYGTAAQGGSSALGLVGQSGYHSIDNSLQDYFFYSREMWVAFKEHGYTNDTWRQLLVSELDKGHPILYSGQSAQGGHGFVCDGYDRRQYMHFNFGWSGIGDGYYPVDSISPGHGGAGGNVTYTFNENNSALIGAVPLYAMRVSDTLFSMGADGGTDSLLFAVNDTSRAQWSVRSDDEWIAVDEAAFSRAGWVRFSVSAFSGDGERAGWIVFTQGDETLRVKVVQANYNEDEMCTLTVLMECTHGSGWQNGACLSLESAGGYVFGIARLEEGERDSVEIRVASHDVYSVWHKGGGSDRFINYYVRNQYDENYVEAVYAYRSGGRHHIEWPCAHVDVKEVTAPKAITLYPNPTHGLLNVTADNLLSIEILDMSGRQVVVFSKATIDMRSLPKGVYFVRVVTTSSTSVQRVIKK